MKKIILTIMFLLSAANLCAQSGTSSGNHPHDSLLFDCGIKQLSVNSDACNPDTMCIIVVYSLTGTATGTVMWYTMEDISTCGPKEMAKVWHCEKRALKTGDRLVPGETVTSGTPTSAVEVRVHYPKGSGKYFETSYSEKGVYRTDRVRYAPGTTFTPGCLKELQRGMIWIQENRDEAEKKINETKDNIIESVKSKIRPKGTEFTVEATDDADIIKVYEGSVEVELKKYDDTDIKNNTAEMKKLQEDYQSGKITMEEMIKRSKELADKVNYRVNDFKVKVTVEAGYQVTAGGKLSEVIPISNDDVKWWSDENFEK